MSEERLKARRVWSKIFAPNVGDKVRFLGLSRRWEVGRIIKIHRKWGNPPDRDSFYEIETNSKGRAMSSHLYLKPWEIKKWLKRESTSSQSTNS